MKYRKGFTLTETLVYVAMLAIILVGVSSFLVWMFNVQAQSRVRRETLYNAQRTMDVMTYHIRRAEDVSVFDSRLEAWRTSGSTNPPAPASR